MRRAGRRAPRRAAGRSEEPLGQPDAAGLGAQRRLDAVRSVDDELGRAAADVDDERPRAIGRSHATPRKRQLGLLVAVEQARREAVAPLDLAEERLAVVGVADGARPDGEDALRAERLRLAAVVDEARCARGRSRSGGGCAARSTDSPSRVIASRRTTSLDAPVARRRRRAGAWCSCRGRRRRRARLTVLMPARNSAAASDARQEPEHAAHRLARLAERLELDVELRPRGREARRDASPSSAPRGARTVEVLLRSARRRVGDPRGLGAERRAGALEPAARARGPGAPRRRAPPTKRRRGETRARSRRPRSGATIVAATRGGAVR